MTRSQALRKHRKMWRLLAEELLKPENKYKDWADIKETIYYKLKGNEEIYVSTNCFLCDYVKSLTGFLNCNKGTCPIIWGNDKSLQCFEAEYDLMEEIENVQEKAKIAKIIAELPRRKLE